MPVYLYKPVEEKAHAPCRVHDHGAEYVHVPGGENTWSISRWLNLAHMSAANVIDNLLVQD